jgi:hypothetical protein
MLPSMDVDVDHSQSNGGSYGKPGRDYEYEQQGYGGRVHNGVGLGNGMTLPPISPGPARGHHGKAEAR